MKKYMRAIYMIGFATLISHSTIARETIGGSNSGSGNSGGSGVKKPTNSEKANCIPTSTYEYMRSNDVSAYLETGGTMFQDRLKGTAGYEVPRTENGNGPKAIFAGSLWMGGKDLSGALKVAAVRFRQVGNDFWAGPLSTDLTKGNYDPTVPVTDNTTRAWGGDVDIPAAECAKWDKFFPMSKSIVIRYSIWWAACDQNSPTANSQDCNEIDPESVPTNQELASINNWPAHGSEALDQDYFLAPFYDNLDNPNNIAGKYEPDQGDTPWYDDILGRDDIQCGVDRRISLFGDNTIWWIFNDKGNIHTESQGDPIGMEIRAQAFTFGTSDEINRMTFYNYELVNRGTQTLENTFFAQYIDADLGGSQDDYVGCDVSRGLGYTFNGDAFDETNQGIGYGANPPAIGVDFFEGPYQDPDGKDNPGPVLDTVTGLMTVVPYNLALDSNGIVYKGIGVGYGDGIKDNERFGMRRFTYFTNGATFPMGDPITANQYYNFMQGFWQDGSQMVYGGSGLTGSPGSTSLKSEYMFPGDSDPLHWGTGGVDPGFDWTEVQANRPFGDRRFVQAAGPFTLVPGAMNNLTVGIVYGRASSEGGLFASVEALKRADTKAQALFDACFRIIDPPTAPKLSIQELENELILTLENPSTGNNLNEGYDELDDINIPPTFLDRNYKFEGYQIYQLVNDAASVSDIGDNSKARLVDQCDLKNDIGDLVNHIFDDEIGFAIPTPKVKAANKGIRHSFQVKEDLFAQGDRRLVNHKTYYYVAIAYAYNMYKPYDPNDPTGIDGQKIPYISSRLNYDNGPIRAVPGVPHNPMPEAGGTSNVVAFGSTPRITRLDGTGNGNRELELTADSRNYIVSNGSMANPTYQYGKGPINVKVIDPLNVKGGYYELKFHSYATNPNRKGADTALWTAYQYESLGGQLLDSVTSDRMISSDNEQIIPNWGVSIQIFQNGYTRTGSGTLPIYNDLNTPISGSLSFSDSTKKWLSFITDDDDYFPTNWIRSGTYDAPAADCLPNVAPWLNPCNYKDDIGQDNAKIYPSLLAGGVAPHKLVGYQADFMPLAYYPGIAFSLPRTLAGQAFAPSVDIVMTTDKSLWTRCPVIELGRTAALNIGGAQPGELRKSPSVGKDSFPDGSGTGMGWFPGYAVDLETGKRLHLAFGENSFLSTDGGNDMIWNPSSRITDAGGNPVMGGCQPIWVFGVDNDIVNGHTNLRNMPAYDPANWANNYLKQQFDIFASSASATIKNDAARSLYGNLMWVINPLKSNNQNLLSSTATIRLRVNKEYHDYVTTGVNGGRPMYSWSMDDIATKTRNPNALAEALQMINVVPNPYYAFSEYERSRLDTRVKITNLPEVCRVRIYTSNGKLVREFKKDSPVTSLDWDLNNHQRIPVASGVYLIHVEVPDIGERVLKFFAGMRQVDLQGI